MAENSRIPAILSVNQRMHLHEKIKRLVPVDDIDKVNAFKCQSCGNLSLFAKCIACHTSINVQMDDAKYEKAVLALNVKCKFANNGCNENVTIGNFLEHKKICNFSTKKLLPILYPDQPNKALQELSCEVDEMKVSLQEMGNYFKSQIKEIEFQLKQHDSVLKKQEELVHQLESNLHDEVKSRLILEEKFKMYKETGQMHCKQGKTNDIPSQHGQGNAEDISSDDLANMSQSISHNMEYIWRITGITQKIQDLKELNLQNVRSDYFMMKSYGLTIRAKMTVNPSSHEYVSVYLEFLDKDNPPRNVEPHFRQYILLDQSNNLRRNDVVMIDYPQFGKSEIQHRLSSSLANSQFFQTTLLATNNDHVKNDCILIKIMFQPIEIMYKSVSSYNGTYLWKILNYREKKEDEINGVVPYRYSEPFYTSKDGYLAQAHMHLNGIWEAKGKYISIFLSFLNGEFDNNLTIPFKYSVKFYILDQSNSVNKKHFGKESQDEYRGSPYFKGYNNFVSHREIEGPNYLKNDSILIKIMVEIL